VGNSPGGNPRGIGGRKAGTIVIHALMPPMAGRTGTVTGTGNRQQTTGNRQQATDNRQ